MIKRIVKMTFRPAEEETFIALFDGVHEYIRGFDGCHSLELVRAVGHEATFFTISTWESEQKLENYRHSQLFRHAWSETKALFAEKPIAWTTMTLYNPA